MFVIIGAPRSGTTLMERLLDSHPTTGVCPEAFLFEYITRLGIENSIKSQWHYRIFMERSTHNMDAFNDPAVKCVTSFYKDNPHFEGSMNTLLQQLERKYKKLKKCQLLGLKAPGYANYINLIQQTCPQAKFIILLRNPLDIVTSLGKGMTKTTMKNYFIDKKLFRLATVIRRAWNSICHVNFDDYNRLFVHYEKLVNDTEQILKKTCYFLGIDFSNEMMYPNSEQYLAFDSAHQHMQIIHQNLTKEIKGYNINSYQKHLSQQQVKFITLFLKREMIQLGIQVQVDHEIKLTWRQQWFLIINHIKFALRIDRFREWKIKQKLRVKYWLFRLGIE